MLCKYLERLQKNPGPALLVLGLFSAFLLFAAGAAALISGTQNRTERQLYVLSQGWTTNSAEKAELPVKFEYQPQGTYDFRTTLQNFHSDEGHLSLLFSAKYMNVSIYLDGIELGSSQCQPEGWDKTAGKAYLLVQLPENLNGKELRILLEPLLGANVLYEVSAPIVGEGSVIVKDMIQKELPLVVIITAILCFGILLLILSIQITAVGDSRKGSSGTFLMTGLFAIVFSFYSLSITNTIYLFLKNSYFIYLMEFLLLALLPLPLLVLILKICSQKFRGFLIADIFAVAVNFALQVVLHFFAGLELRNTVVFTHVMIALSLLLLVPTLFYTGKEKKEKSRIGLIISFVPIVVGALLDVTRFYLPSAHQKAIGFQIGVLLFILIQTFYLIRSYLEYYQSYLKSNVYHRMAYTDALTGLPNRTAFEEKIVLIRKNYESYASIWCVSADINNLKWVNDHQGHSMGDELIRAAAKVLRAALQGSGEIYRTGGDEFVGFVFDQTETSMRIIKERFDTAVQDHNRENKAALSIAFDYDCFQKDGDTIMELLTRTDEKMYRNKQLQKETLSR